MHPALQLLRFFFATLLMLYCCASHAAISVDLARLTPGSELAGRELGLRFLQDAQQTLSIGALITMPENRFQMLRTSAVNQRFRSGDYWLKASVHNASAAPLTWVLRHPMPITDYVDYWVVTNDAVATHATGGDRTLASQRQIPYRIASVRHTSQPGEVAHIYIRMRNREVIELFDLVPVGTPVWIGE